MSAARREFDELRQRHAIGIGDVTSGDALPDHASVENIFYRNSDTIDDDDDEEDNDRANGVSSTDESKRSDDEDEYSNRRKQRRRKQRAADAALIKSIPQDADSAANEILEQSLTSLPLRWRNWAIRFLFTALMIAAAGWIVYKGPLAMVTITAIVHIWCFKEVIDIGYSVYRVDRLPWFRTLSWYFLFASSFFIYGHSIVSGMSAYFREKQKTEIVLSMLINYHHFISFCLYIAGFVIFVLTLKKGYYFRQFSLFAFTHTGLLILDVAAYSLISNLFDGVVWWILPCMMIVTNDVMAYVFGFFFGKTPLIRLSPKKTWEGFIGGAASTVVIGMLLASVLERYQYFTCPVEFDDKTRSFVMQCNPSPPFAPTHHTISGFPFTIRYPFVFIHAVALSLFSSLVGPFGGFFASGFKRAVRVKDFGAVIPGHGGLMDRFDCQVLMAMFVNVYIRSFIRSTTPHRVLHQVTSMDVSDQLAVYEMLGKMLTDNGLIGSPKMTDNNASSLFEVPEITIN